MRISPNIRIQWFHEELIRNSYPNAVQLAKRFNMSRRQAQRDIDFLRKQLEAPLSFDQGKNGYRYTAPFTLPIAIATENDEALTHASVFSDGFENAPLEADSVIIQSQIPYTALLHITDRLTVLEMRHYIISEEDKGQYLCEFHNMERFLCAILTARSGIRILEPLWLRDKLLRLAEKAIQYNT